MWRRKLLVMRGRKVWHETLDNEGEGGEEEGENRGEDGGRNKLRNATHERRCKCTSTHCIYQLVLS